MIRECIRLDFVRNQFMWCAFSSRGSYKCNWLMIIASHRTSAQLELEKISAELQPYYYTFDIIGCNTFAELELRKHRYFNYFFLYVPCRFPIFIFDLPLIVIASHSWFSSRISRTMNHFFSILTTIFEAIL